MDTDRSKAADHQLLKMFAKDLLWNSKSGICGSQFDKYRTNKRAEFAFLKQVLNKQSVTL
jgi:hypothetical protein